MFQSAPANYGGRIPFPEFVRCRSIVSIRARQLRRANLYFRNLLINIKYFFDLRQPITEAKPHYGIQSTEKINYLYFNQVDDARIPPTSDRRLGFAQQALIKQLESHFQNPLLGTLQTP